MPSLDLRASVTAPVELVYQVVADVERYPEFLPDVIAVDKRDDIVSMTLCAGLLSTRLVTRARFDPPRVIELELIRGPFRRFSGRWTFSPTPDATTEVAYHADYEIPLLGSLFAGTAHALLEQQTERQIQGFVARVRELKSVAPQRAPGSRTS
jgi:ribosome-associated toxin RatA of RatAB toxin-antitoxin module